MMNFTEKQKFKQVWIWLLLLGIACVGIWGAVQQLIFKIPFGNKPAPDWVMILIVFATFLPIMLFWFLQLETEVDSTGIYYRFRPFHFKKRFIAWNEITEAHVREYKPLKEYGGWGIRGSVRNGKAFNVSGNKGLQVVLSNGKKILLGTQKDLELADCISKLKKN